MKTKSLHWPSKPSMNRPHYLLASSLISLIPLLGLFSSHTAPLLTFRSTNPPPTLEPLHPGPWPCFPQKPSWLFPIIIEMSASPWDLLQAPSLKCNSHPCAPCLFLAILLGTFHSLICNMVSFFLCLTPVSCWCNRHSPEEKMIVFFAHCYILNIQRTA